MERGDVYWEDDWDDEDYSYEDDEWDDYSYDDDDWEEDDEI